MESEPTTPERGPTTAARLGKVGQAFGVGFVGLVAGALMSGFGLAVPESEPVLRVVVSTVAFGLGLAGVAMAYLGHYSLGTDFIDLEVPSLRDVGIAAAGFVGLWILLIGVSLLFQYLGVQSQTSSIQRRAQQSENIAFLLAYIPLSLLVIGPGEELVYRNIVQKSLYDYFSRAAAIVLASVVFASVHILQYAGQSPLQNPLQTVSSLLVVFVLAIVLGTIYERTENILVPIAVHGLFNAVQFALLYVRFAYDIAPSALV